MNTRTLIYPVLALVAAGAILAATRPWRPAPEAAAAPPARVSADTALVEVALPATLAPAATRGKTAFEAICATCHGVNAAGHAGKGPPFVHKIYEPNHHGDGAFLMAARRGVQAHHWPFGDMPPVEGLTDADIADIVAYVRALQRENGIE